jgi:hypothetical protein
MSRAARKIMVMTTACSLGPLSPAAWRFYQSILRSVPTFGGAPEHDWLDATATALSLQQMAHWRSWRDATCWATIR